MLIEQVDDSACSAHHAGEPSGVLLAMGYDEQSARGLIRVSLGRFITQEQVLRCLKILETAVASTIRPRALKVFAGLESLHEQDFERANC